MARKGNDYMTLADHARMYKDGKLFRMVMMLSQKNRMLDDAVFTEANNGAAHKVSVTTSLPETYLRILNKGVPISKGTADMFDEQSAIFESWSDIDEDIAELGGDVAAIRLRNSKWHMESMNQRAQRSMLYGSASTPEDVIGFANRASATADVNGDNILKAGGTTNLGVTSCYLIGWGEDKVHCFYPKGSKAGFEHKYHGKRVLDEVSGDQELRRVVYSDQWKWKWGLAVEDHRFLVRIPNIEVADIRTISGTQAPSAATNVLDLMTSAIDHLPDTNDCKPAFYVNRTVASGIRLIAKRESNSALAIQPATNQFGRGIDQLSIHGIPIRLVDQITNFEALVV